MKARARVRTDSVEVREVGDVLELSERVVREDEGFQGGEAGDARRYGGEVAVAGVQHCELKLADCSGER